LTKILGITAVLATLGLSSAYAAEAPTTQKPQRALKADVNQDGKVSYEEFRAAHEQRVEERFKKIDANSDGFIDQAEREAAYKNWGEKRKVKHERRNKHKRGAAEAL